jgi:RNA polymerase sigma-70 factor, ECF subfamily
MSHGCPNGNGRPCCSTISADSATALGVSEGNARVILHRGLSTLRASLGNECTLDFADDIPCERRA